MPSEPSNFENENPTIATRSKLPYEDFMIAWNQSAYGNQHNSNNVQLVETVRASADQSLSELGSLLLATDGVEAQDGLKEVLASNSQTLADLEYLGLPPFKATKNRVPAALMVVSRADGNVPASVGLLVKKSSTGMDRSVGVYLLEDRRQFDQGLNWVEPGEPLKLTGRHPKFSIVPEKRITTIDPDASGFTSINIEPARVLVDNAGADEFTISVLTTPERAVESKKNATRKKKLGFVATAIGAAGLITGIGSSMIDTDDNATLDAVAVTAPETTTTTTTIPEIFSYPDNYDPTAVLSENTQVKQALVDNFLQDESLKAAPFDLEMLNGIERQRLMTDKSPADRASMVSIFNVDIDGQLKSQGSGFISRGSADGAIELTTIEHVIRSGTKYSDEQSYLEPGYKKIVYVPDIGFIDISSSFSSFYETKEFDYKKGDQMVSLKLPVAAQDAMQLLAERGDIAPLTIDDSMKLVEGTNVSVGNVYGGGVNTGGRVGLDDNGEQAIIFDIVDSLGINTKIFTQERVTGEVQEYFDNEFASNDSQEDGLKRLALVTCGGNSGSPIFIETQAGRTAIGSVRSHDDGTFRDRDGDPDDKGDELLVWLRAQEGDQEVTLGKYCAWRIKFGQSATVESARSEEVTE